jgi:hypothetical protein
MQKTLLVRLTRPLPLSVEFRSVGRYGLQLRQMTAGDLRWRLYVVAPDNLTEIIMSEGYRSREALEAAAWKTGLEVTTGPLAETYWKRLIRDSVAERVG